MRYLLLILLISGCAYTGITYLKISGEDVDVPIGGMATIKGRIINMEISRTTNFCR